MYIYILYIYIYIYVIICVTSCVMASSPLHPSPGSVKAHKCPSIPAPPVRNGSGDECGDHGNRSASDRGFGLAEQICWPCRTWYANFPNFLSFPNTSLLYPQYLPICVYPIETGNIWAGSMMRTKAGSNLAEWSLLEFEDDGICWTSWDIIKKSWESMGHSVCLKVSICKPHG